MIKTPTFWFITIFCFIGGMFTRYCMIPNHPQKEYPIEVQCFWKSGGYQSYPTMECDSIKGDTLWKDGKKIVTKNIINVSFK